MARRFTINLNGSRGCDQLISEVQWMNGLYMAKLLHVQAQTHTYDIVKSSGANLSYWFPLLQVEEHRVVFYRCAAMIDD